MADIDAFKKFNLRTFGHLKISLAGNKFPTRGSGGWMTIDEWDTAGKVTCALSIRYCTQAA